MNRRSFLKSLFAGLAALPFVKSLTKALPQKDLESGEIWSYKVLDSDSSGSNLEVDLLVFSETNVYKYNPFSGEYEVLPKCGMIKKGTKLNG